MKLLLKIKRKVFKSKYMVDMNIENHIAVLFVLIQALLQMKNIVFDCFFVVFTINLFQYENIHCQPSNTLKI